MEGLDPWVWYAIVVFCVIFLVLGFVFSQVGPRGKGQIRDDPYFASHQVCVMLFTCYLGLLGAYAWFTEPGKNSSRERVEHFSAMGWYAAQLMFILQIWDLFTTVAVASLRTWEMALHHVMVAALCIVAFRSKYMTYYANFGCGLLEVTTIPLCLVTLWRPDRCGAMIEGKKGLQALNAALRIVFAVLFLSIRGIYGALYVLPTGIYDIATCGLFDPVTRTIAVIAVAFLTFLQLKWSSLILQQVLKMLSGKPKKDDNATAKADPPQPDSPIRRASRRISESLENMTEADGEPIPSMRDHRQRRSSVCLQ